jgi:hypothetical protein
MAAIDDPSTIVYMNLIIYALCPSQSIDNPLEFPSLICFTSPGHILSLSHPPLLLPIHELSSLSLTGVQTILWIGLWHLCNLILVRSVHIDNGYYNIRISSEGGVGYNVITTSCTSDTATLSQEMWNRLRETY